MALPGPETCADSLQNYVIRLAELHRLQNLDELYRQHATWALTLVQQQQTWEEQQRTWEQQFWHQQQQIWELQQSIRRSRAEEEKEEGEEEEEAGGDSGGGQLGGFDGVRWARGAGA